jgi:polysaccharide export outer membrane protein
VKLFVWREPDLSRDYEVDGFGRIDVPMLGLVTVAGLSPDSLRRMLEVRFSKSLRTPTIEVSMRRRISVLGSVRTPGVFQVDPYVTVAAALAMAGGTTGDARTDYVRVLRGNTTLDTKVSARTLIADSPVESGDQLFVPDRGWITRNLVLISTALSAASWLIISLR